MDLAKRAMLLNPTICLPLLGERKDKAATATVEREHDVQHKRAKATKYLIDRNAKSVKAVIASAQNLRAVIYDGSFAWMDSKLRLSTVKAFPALKTQWEQGKIRLDNAVENYFMDYPALRSKAEIELGSLYDSTQYPSTDQLRETYRVSLELWPFPQSGHFVADIAQEAASEAKAMMENRIVSVINHSVNDMVTRSEKVVSHFVEKLDAYGVDTKVNKRGNSQQKVVGIFRDTLVTNISETAELIRKLNFVDDSAIDSLCVQLDRLGRVTAEALRDDPELRKNKANEAKSLLAKLDTYRKTDTEVSNIVGSVADYWPHNH